MKLNPIGLTRVRHIIALTFALVLAWTVGLLAQQPEGIFGVVRDKAAGLPIPGAVVILRGSALQAVSDENGRYSLVNTSDPAEPNFGIGIEPGNYDLEVRANGYKPSFVKGVTVTVDRASCQVDIEMEPGHKTNFIVVGPSGRYFVHEDGTPYVPAGFHHQIVEPDFNAAWDPHGKWGAWWNYDPDAAERFAEQLSRQGISMIRVFLEEAYILEGNLRWALFQDPVGIYNPDVVAHWDQLFDWADKYGFKILVSLYHTDQAMRNWRNYPYFEQQGGPAGERPDQRWFTDPAVKAAQKRDLKYVIDRWGQRDSFFALDLMNEADNWPASESIRQEWIAEMADFARSYMIERWGKAHLLTVSAANYVAEGKTDTFINNPKLDFVNTHMYFGRIANPQVGSGYDLKTDVITPALEANFTAETVLSTMDKPKPYFDSEHGPIAARLPLDQFCIIDGMQSPLADETYFHNIIWANFVAGAAGVPTRWGFRPNTPLGYRLTDEMLDDIGRLRRFALMFDLANFAPKPVSDLTSASRDDLFVMGSIDENQGMFWILQDREPLPDEGVQEVAGASVTVPVMSPGRYIVRFYNTHAGQAGPELTLEAEGLSLTVELPVFLYDVAFQVVKVR